MIDEGFKGTIFDTNSVWAAEALRDRLEEAGGFDSIVVRNTKIPSDMDCIRWKLISNVPYVEQEIKENPRSRKRRK